MLNQDEEKEEEKQEDKEEEIKPNEPTVKDLSEILAVLSQVQDKVTALQFNSRDQALVYFRDLTKIFSENLNEKINARSQTLITRFFSQQHEMFEAQRRATLNASSDEEDDVDMPPVQLEEDLYDGWEHEETEALQIENEFRQRVLRREEGEIREMEGGLNQQQGRDDRQ
ncbi:hypothetical protein Pcinc_010847 [Petrolisthes cinctipes]|uniref:Uncharacterized protein n=1 Tax=Petrolisthes cinctipes TaxID=88211 RepID=A0AAE1KV05_PETCI|nr:hypothetical protein Pcinc_010847 [Petrolisthes cinctipes]